MRICYGAGTSRWEFVFLPQLFWSRHITPPPGTPFKSRCDCCKIFGSSHRRTKELSLSLECECNITLTRGGMYWKLRPPRTERFAEVLILHPEAREIARGRSPRAISRAEGCKINAEANLEVRGGRNFQWIPTLVSVITFFFPRRGCFDFSFWPAHCVL